MANLRKNRNRIFGLGVILTLIMAGVIWQVTAREGQAQSGGGFSCPILEIELDSPATLPSLTSGASASPSNIYAGGNVFSHLTGELVGRVRMWGFKQTDEVVQNTSKDPVQLPVATVNIFFELPGFNGTIAGQGTLNDIVNDGLHGQVVISPGGVLTFNGDDVIAITGGSGTFRGINGDALLQRKSDSSFTVWVKEGRRK